MYLIEQMTKTEKKMKVNNILKDYTKENNYRPVYVESVDDDRNMVKISIGTESIQLVASQLKAAIDNATNIPF